MKSKFIKSTLILLIGGFITKLIGMIIRIVMTRLLGTEGIGTYMLIMPTFSLLICIAQFSLPQTISKLIAEDTKNNKNLVLSILPLSLIFNTIIIFNVLIFSNYISLNLLHNSNTLFGIKCISFTLPFISISSIIRGYFFGKQRMFPHVISNIIEDIIRLLILIIGIPIFIKKGINITIGFIILSNIISETSSIIVMLFFLPNKITIKRDDFLLKSENFIDVLYLSIPTTMTRIIGNIGYFLEPIILTNLLLYTGYNESYIVNEYGILNGYVLPILLLPSFFTIAISQALIPVISKAYVKKNYKEIKRKLNLSIFISLFIGISSSTILFLFPNLFLNLLYNTNKGSLYLKILSPIFILQYLESPINSALNAMGKVKITFKTTLYGVIIKLSLITILSLFKIGIYSLIISEIINILFVTIYNIYKIKKCIN